MRNREFSPSVHLYGNLLIDTQYKFEMFRFTLPLWLAFWGSPATIRVRGSFSQDAYDFCRALPGVSILRGSRLKTWRVQSLADVSQIAADYIFQYLEDHMPTPEAENWLRLELLRKIGATGVDIVPYSFYAATSEFRGFIRSPNGRSDVLHSRTISKSDALTIHQASRPYLIALPSIFRRDLLIRILETYRPIVRTYSPRSPANIEKRVGRTFFSVWFCPIKIGVLGQELGICLDDGNSAAFSDAISRNLYFTNAGERPENLRGSRSVRAFFDSFFSTKMGHFSRVFALIGTLVDTFIFSVQGIAFGLSDRFALKGHYKSFANPKSESIQK